MTLGGASALGMEKVIGTLEKGKSADLAVLSFGHISQLPVNDVYSAILFSSSARDVLLTMVAGNEVCRSGRSTRVDEADLRQRLAHLTAKL
jgi:5-methylthioadenosine/S-adenosylhomocysteine deaminase